LVALRQTCNQAWSDIEVQLKQRQDLVPQLVNTVKGYAKHEKGTFEDVIKARNMAVCNMAVSADTPKDAAAAEGFLTQALGKLFALAEAYPELKANTNFLQLQDQLSDIENKIAASRRFYNNAAQEYNTSREQFPAILDIATKSKSVTISQEPRAYRMLENLSISRGQTTPKLKVIETPVMNAFASGIRDSNYTVTLTRGLMENLDDEELEAVIAHELSHVRNRDVRLLIIAVIFVGIFSFVGEGLVRGIFRTNLARNDTHRRSGGGNAGALIFFAFIIIAVAYLLAMLTRFALSRKREYMADAGAVELTKNPDAMIRALQKISGRAELTNMPAEIKEMAFENPRIGLAGVFATHPPIEKRIEALVKYAGGRPVT